MFQCGALELVNALRERKEGDRFVGSSNFALARGRTLRGSRSRPPSSSGLLRLLSARVFFEPEGYGPDGGNTMRDSQNGGRRSAYAS